MAKVPATFFSAGLEEVSVLIKQTEDFSRMLHIVDVTF